MIEKVEKFSECMPIIPQSYGDEISYIEALNAIQEKIDELVTAVNGKSTVSVSATGTATDEVQYITVDGVEKKLAGGTTDFEQLSNRPKYNGSVMTGSTNIPEYTEGDGIVIDGNEIGVNAYTANEIDTLWG